MGEAGFSTEAGLKGRKRWRDLHNAMVQGTDLTKDSDALSSACVLRRKDDSAAGKFACFWKNDLCICNKLQLVP